MNKLLTFLFAVLLSVPALAQDGTNHSVPVFGGPGFVGFRTAGPCGPGQILAWTSASVDPTCTNGSSLSATCLNITSPAFGGAGDNTVDNVAPLTAAYTALSGTGGCIYFPPGKYKFTTSLSYNIPAGIFSVTLVGSGPDSTVLTWPNASGGLTYNYAGISSSAHLRDLSLTTGTTNGGNALTLNMASSVVNVGVAATSDIYRVTMRGDDGYRTTDYWTIGLNIANVSGVQVDNLTVSGSSTQQGIGTTITGLPGSSTYAVVLDIAKSNYFGLASGLIYGSFVQGVTVDQTNFTFVTNGIGSAGSETGALVQLAVTNSQFNPGTVSGGTGINTATVIGGLQILNNFFVIGGPSQFGIIVASAGHYAIAYNQLQGINSTSGNAIVIGAQVSGAPGIVAYNDIYGWGAGGLGIWLQATSANVLVSGNVFASNASNILNQGTNNSIFNLAGSTSGGASIVAPAVAGTPTLTLPNTTGTFAISAGASAPLSVNTTTGAIGWAGMSTSGLLYAGSATTVATDRCTMDGNQSISCTSASSFLPQTNFSNSAADVSSAIFNLNKTRTGGNTNNGDTLGVFSFRGFANAGLQDSVRLTASQTAASSGSNIPTKVVLATSNAAGQLNQSFTLDNFGHAKVIASTSPTLTAGCNGAGQVISGGDTHGTITGQTTASTSCTLTFANAYAAAPDCVVSGLTAPLTGAVTVGTGTLVVNFASVANFKWSYHCFGL